jgi:bacteriocin-like protein
MDDDDQSQPELEELNEQELDAISGGFDPQPDPPTNRLKTEPPNPDIRFIKLGGEQQH